MTNTNNIIISVTWAYPDMVTCPPLGPIPYTLEVGATSAGTCTCVHVNVIMLEHPGAIVIILILVITDNHTIHT